MESSGDDRRKGPLLPPPTAATAKAAREKANSVISAAINSVGGNRPAEHAQQELVTEAKIDGGGGF
jgi:hypothetical protein